jgi:carbon storage regulator CsrA
MQFRYSKENELMLILTRRLQEAIVINHNLFVRVMGVTQLTGCKPQVKLGITAPKHITINRDEIEDLLIQQGDFDFIESETIYTINRERE